MEKKKLYDLVGIACGIILLLVLIISHVQANNSQKLEFKATTDDGIQTIRYDLSGLTLTP